MGVNISWGDRFSFENGTLGVLSGALWNNGWDYENFNRNYFLVGQNSTLEKSHTYNYDPTESRHPLVWGLDYAI